MVRSRKWQTQLCFVPLPCQKRLFQTKREERSRAEGMNEHGLTSTHLRLKHNATYSRRTSRSTPVTAAYDTTVSQSGRSMPLMTCSKASIHSGVNSSEQRDLGTPLVMLYAGQFTQWLFPIQALSSEELSRQQLSSSATTANSNENLMMIPLRLRTVAIQTGKP